MSKLTLNAAIALLRFALGLIPKVVRILYTVVDLVDDGCLNNSAPRPAWLSKVQEVIDALTDAGSLLSGVQTEIDHE